MAEALSFPDLSSPDDPAMRILLMGRKGSGKSSSGNTILGQRTFEVQKHKTKLKAEDKLNKVCEEMININKMQVHVIDPPDLLDPDLTKEKFKSLKEELLNLCSAGLSAVLLILPLETKVENEEEILYLIKDILGADVQKYIMVLFTHGDELEDLDQTIDEYLQDKDHADLQQLVTECGGRFHCFNNRSKEKDQVTQLLQKIERMAAENDGNFLRRGNNRGTFNVNFSGESPADEISDEHLIPDTKQQQIRLVLLGKTGVGKSATGNTILGRNVFQCSHTKHCTFEKTTRIGKEISVIDTPGLYDTELCKDEVKKEIVKCMIFSSPGPHAFLIVVKVGRFTEEEKNTVKQLKEVFGDQMEKYTMIIFTHKDQLDHENKSIEEFVQDAEPDLQTLIKKCGNRYFCMDNNSGSFPQFRDLLNKIEMMVAENGGMHFTNEMFVGAEKSIQEIQKQNPEEKEKLCKEEHEDDIKEWQKIFWSLAREPQHEAEGSFLCDPFITALAQFMGRMAISPQEMENTINEAESKGISRGDATRFAIRAKQKLARQKICGGQEEDGETVSLR